MNSKILYKVAFINQGEIYEVFVKSINQSDIFGFIEIADFVFGETSKMVVDPAEERLKLEFKDVQKCLIPMHSVIRIDTVDKRGVAKISNSNDKANKIANFPSSVYTLSPNENKSGEK